MKLTPGFIGSAAGSCLIEMGRTRVVCTACLEEGVPKWRESREGLGWLTAEYGMLPASGGRRKARPMGRPDGRAAEIQRTIGRVLRNAVRFDRLGARTVYVDCDVLEADGGTRTAAITGSYVAVAQALSRAEARGVCRGGVLAGAVAAVSVGIVAGWAVLDLDYAEDEAAEVDMNVAMTASGRFIEVQATGEKRPFDAGQLEAMLRLARRGIRKLLAMQQEILR